MAISLILYENEKKKKYEREDSNIEFLEKIGFCNHNVKKEFFQKIS